jgi:hypothetical protein
MKIKSESGKVTDRNNHIREYLKYYISFSHSPGYAVVLNGAWGIGKTFLIKKILDEYFHKNDGYVYLSLYGITSTEEIDEALIAAVYPILGLKGVKIAGRVLKSVLKFKGVETDLKPSDFLSKYKTKLFVFDDLERCEVKPLNKVLGYINEFVEHDGCKVLIIANEKEIDEGEDYLRRREKLIGKTLEVQSSFEEALEYFISLINDSDTKDFVKNKTAVISAIYGQSKLDNLRILQQTIWDFERVFQVLSSRHKANDEAMTVLLKMFFALSFELKAGRISGDDLMSRMSSLVAAMVRLNKDAIPSPLVISGTNYPDIDFGNSILSDKLLLDILSRGIVDRDAVHESLDRSDYFVDRADELPWRVVWRGNEQTDEDFDRAFNEIERQFQNREFTIIGEMLHIFGIRLWLSDVGVISKPRVEVLSELKKYVDDLYCQKKLDPIPLLDYQDFDIHSYGGLGVREAATTEFRDAFEYLKGKRHLAGIDLYPVQGETLLKELARDPNLYYRQLCVTNSDDNIYCRVPILSAIDPSLFVKNVLEQTPSNQRLIMSAFKGRYEHGSLGRDLSIEKPWLKSVRDLFDVASTSKSIMGKYQIQKNLEWFIDPYL